MVSQIYYAEHEKSLSKLIGSECSGWYGHLATLTVATLTMALLDGLNLRVRVRAS